jgi:hypothetical protein
MICGRIPVRREERRSGWVNQGPGLCPARGRERLEEPID